MNFLLDTNVISEGAKPRPHLGMMGWLASVDEEHLFLSVVSVAELRFGIERMTAGKRRTALNLWLTNDLPERFGDHLLGINNEIADLWGRIVARSWAAGRPIHAMDALIAATAERYQLTLVTRNTSDFEATGIRLFDPWTDS